MEFLGFVPEPNCGRGTLGIVWNCLSTLFLVVWVSCHPETLKPSSTKSWLFKKKLDRSIWYLIFPELGAMQAVDGLFSTLELRGEMRKIPNWEHFGMKQAFLVEGLKGLYRTGNSTPLDSRDVVLLAQSRQLDPKDFPTDEEIEDRSKSSGVLKAISISQTLWFMVNTAWRLKSSYQITPLEDLTVAHAFCGFVMFVGWFRCPQDIHQPFGVPIRGEPPAIPGSHGTRKRAFYGLKNQTQTLLFVALFGIFTGIHLAAWNYPFATVPEAWIWRTFSIMIFVLGILTFMIGFFDEEIEASTGRDIKVPFVVMSVSYGIIRIAILVVALMAFRRAPASIYDKPSWSAYWPHLG